MKYADPLAHRTPDGSCELCGQKKITWRHECAGLRKLNAKLARASRKTRSVEDKYLGEDFTSRYKTTGDEI